MPVMQAFCGGLAPGLPLGMYARLVPPAAHNTQCATTGHLRQTPAAADDFRRGCRKSSAWSQPRPRTSTRSRHSTHKWAARQGGRPTDACHNELSYVEGGLHKARNGATMGSDPE